MDDFTSIIGFIPAEYHSTILAALTVASLALPLLQWIANKTANTWDNALVARIEWVLARVPRIGFGNTQRAKDAVQRTSLKPPRVPDVLLVLLSPMSVALLFHVTLFGCAGSPADAALQNRLEANALRAEVNEASDVLAQAHGALPFVCAYLGPDSAACLTLEDSYRVLASAVDTAHRGIDLLDAVGVGAVQTRAAVERVLSEAEAFGASVKRAGEEVQYAIEGHRRDRDAGGEDLGRGVEPSPGAAPAEGASAPAAGAAQ